MFGIFKKKKQPKSITDEMVKLIYGDSHQNKRPNQAEAVELADDLLMGQINKEKLKQHAIALDDGTMPYSTYDLGLSIALYHFKQPENVPHLWNAQLTARIKMMKWYQKGLVAHMLAESFEHVLYRLYKPKA